MGKIVSGIGSVVGGVFGDDRDDAARAAAAERSAAATRGIEAITEQRDLAEERLDPFITAGQESLEALRLGATPGGFGTQLEQIRSGPGFAPLFEQRTRDIQGQLAAAGLTRSGTGARAIADTNTQLALDLANLIGGRQTNLANLGFSGATNLSQLGLGGAANIANIEAQKGLAIAQGLQQSAQAQFGRTQNIFGGAANIAQGVANFL